MLSITRREGESVRIGEAIVTIAEIKAGSVRLDIQAPREVIILREELELPTKEGN